MKKFLLLLLLGGGMPMLLRSQKMLTIPLPDITLFADKLNSGDCDLYGLGSWQYDVSIKTEGAYLTIKAKAVFSEENPDYTVIEGVYSKRIYVEELAKYAHCELEQSQFSGSVSGKNIGARGYRWYSGSGSVKKAWIQTDTFGCDVGKIGGTIQLHPLRVSVQCAYATTAE
jgi:hypothetical protein